MVTALERQFLHQNAVLGNLLQQQVLDDATGFSSVYPQAVIKLQLLCKAATKEELPPMDSSSQHQEEGSHGCGEPVARGMGT
jgi:hypothetical protein